MSTRVDVLCGARCIGLGAEASHLRRRVGVWVYCLPDSEQSINLPLQGMSSGIWHQEPMMVLTHGGARRSDRSSNKE